MEELEDLIHRLNTDQYQAVSVYDSDKGVYIHKDVTHEVIKSKFGSAEDFFEDIHAKGHTRLMIHPKRRNGKNAFRVKGEPFQVKFGNQSTMENKTDLVQKKKKKKVKSESGLFGLGAIEIMDLKFQANDKARFESENRELKEKNQRLESEIALLKEAELKQKYSREDKESLYGLIKDGFKSAPMFLKAAGVDVPFVGMGATVDTSGLSEVKAKFIDLVKDADDDMIQLLDVIYKNIIVEVETNDFANDLQKLLQIHQILQD